MRNVRACRVAIAVLAFFASASSARAQDDMSGAMSGIFHLSGARGPLRAVDLTPFAGDVSSEILAGPTNGLESAFVVYTRMKPGARPRGLFTLPVDHTYLVLSGRLNVQIGTDTFVAGPDTFILVPAGVPHQVWNEGSAPEVDFQVIAPAPSRDLVSMMKRAEPRKIENAAQYVRAAPSLDRLSGGTGHDSLNERVLVDRDTGSEHVLERLNDVLPGGGRTEPHLHPFDQVYFVTRGTMTVEYGTETYEAPANSIVILPKGVVHSNQNNGSSTQSLITLLLPAPKPGVPLGGGFEIRRPKR